MSFGIQTFNTSGNMTIDDTTITYVYLGKYALTGYGEQTVNITCVGFPLVFFDIPYNLNDVSYSSTNRADFMGRWGANSHKVESVGTNTWKVTYNLNYPAGTQSAITMNIRVFGRTQDNYPSGSSDSYGFRVFGPTGNLVMDSGLRTLKLAGNTYDTELLLNPNVPNDGELITKYDTVITLPFDMQNKSICATTRGIIPNYYFTGQYYDPGAGYYVDQYDAVYFESMYFARNSNLEVRRIGTSTGRFENLSGSGAPFDGGGNVYSRLAIIDNTQFP